MITVRCDNCNEEHETTSFDVDEVTTECSECWDMMCSNCGDMEEEIHFSCLSDKDEEE